MHTKQAFESDSKRGCGHFGRGGFNNHWAGAMGGRGKFGGFRRQYMEGFHRPPVNIEETETAYTISLYAAGLVKEHIKLTVKDDILILSYTPVDSAGTDAGNNERGNVTYREFHSQSFERSFQLNNKVLTENISATYTDGIVTVTLPKNPATNVPAQTINVN